MIQVNQVFHDYEGKGKCAVSDITFSVESGSIFGFLGPSGAGKSTIQNIMTGLLPIQKGEVLYDGKSVRHLNTGFFNQIGVSFEQNNLYSSLTGLENLKYHAALFSVPTVNPMELLERVGLREDANKRVSNYSKGMRQRLTFARSLINKPQYLFLDEPTSGLDPKTAVGIRELILEQKARGAAVFLTTHSMELADALSDTVAFLYGGVIAAMDTPEALKRVYGKREVRVVYREGEEERERAIPLDDKAALSAMLTTADVVKLHSQEATLEEIFLRVTGKELTA
ncbi:MAG: ATP-binding protein [Firmicutes bacterium HGW-Firmicutes-9]|jgi:fluoroquinolone transport system ATP-binding protein|nr:MAG: ATP-binding protein [Firmicutes bacterium HGW-Firmicutes-9]